MDTYLLLLEKLFQNIPVYGYGSILDLEKIRTRYVKVMDKIGQDEAYRTTTERLTVKANIIGQMVQTCINAKSERAHRSNFEKASNELGIDIESLIWKLENGLPAGPVFHQNMLFKQ